MVTIVPNYSDTKTDLLLAILVALGGTMADVKNLYDDTKKDILFAILSQLSSGKVGILVDSYDTPATTEGMTIVNYPAIIGASKLLITIGGIYIDSVVIDGRYYQANTSAVVSGGLQPGDINLPPVVAGEQINIFKF